MRFVKTTYDTYLIDADGRRCRKARFSVLPEIGAVDGSATMIGREGDEEERFYWYDLETGQRKYLLTAGIGQGGVPRFYYVSKAVVVYWHNQNVDEATLVNLRTLHREVIAVSSDGDSVRISPRLDHCFLYRNQRAVAFGSKPSTIVCVALPPATVQRLHELSRQGRR